MCSLTHAMLENVSMDCRGVVPLGVVLMLVLTSCAPPDIQAVWPEPRPLGKDIPSYRPPLQPPDAVPSAQVVTNPTVSPPYRKRKRWRCCSAQSSQRLAGRSALGRYVRCRPV